MFFGTGGESRPMPYFSFKGYIMITKREWQFDRDGTIHMRNTVDVSEAIEQAKTYNEMGMGNGKNGYMMGVIPEEFFSFDPWLKEARRYKREGDMGKYTEYMLRFFRVHSALAVNHRKAQWNGYCVPIFNKNDTPQKKNKSQLIAEELMRSME